MRRFLPLLSVCWLLAVLALPVGCGDETGGTVPERPAWALVVHGGAGTITREAMDDSTEQAYRDALTEALQTGGRVLDEGGSSLDAVEQVIRFLEDSPLFNAGRGAVFTDEGTNELDASIMEGDRRDAGAVAGVRTVRHPISAARRVMDSSPHVMLTREGAEAFAAGHGLELVDPGWFRTERRWQGYLRAKARRDTSGAAADPGRKHGTVGCVALDRGGHLAAGTSTGGTTLKRWGRVGDSPVIGAGTWADDRTCGVSATGHGEFFIRNAVAHDIAARMQHGGATLEEAARAVIHEVLAAQGATGGVVALDARGHAVMVFNTEGMYRGRLTAGGEPAVAVYGPDDAP